MSHPPGGYLQSQRHTPYQAADTHSSGYPVLILGIGLGLQRSLQEQASRRNYPDLKGRVGFLLQMGWSSRNFKQPFGLQVQPLREVTSD
jgi:hypothetical protein